MDSFCIFLKDKKEQSNGWITPKAFYKTGISLDIIYFRGLIDKALDF